MQVPDIMDDRPPLRLFKRQMRNALLREVTIMLLAALPMLALILLCQGAGYHGAADPLQDELARLPARGISAPLLGGAGGTDQDAARARNAADPFDHGALEPAKSFRWTGSVSDFSNARDCLALAALAEAGASEAGQRAVMQVVLNRVRHPAFAHTVCGAVFEGSERSAGCQFTFTCDGALARRYGEAAWMVARERAEQALKGYVFAAVGTATHYHTDWVYPAWSPQLLKIAQIETHLFFRWPGYWGSRGAARMTYRGGEPALAQLAGWQQDQLPGKAIAPPPAPLPSDTPRISSGTVMLRYPTGKANFLLLAPGGGTGSALGSARQLCNTAGTCRVYGWLDPAQVPVGLPLSRAARAALQFSYARDPGGAEIVLYNCDNFPAVPREQCIPRAR